jgi:uncharacterized protein YndB with AHSA1/START domain
MQRVETSIIIQRPLDQIFAYLIEPSNLPEWAPGYVQARSTSDSPIGVGSTSMRVTNFGGRRSESQYTVINFEPNAQISFATQSGPLTIVEIFQVQQAGAGTRVTIAEEVSSRLVLKPIEWIFAFMASRNIAQYGEALKHQLEGMAG